MYDVLVVVVNSVDLCILVIVVLFSMLCAYLLGVDCSVSGFV